MKMIKVAIIAAVIYIVVLGAAYALENQSPKGTNWYVFNENQDEWTGRVLFLPETIEVKDCCRLWPVDQPLELNGYWYYSIDFDQWIVCH